MTTPWQAAGYSDPEEWAKAGWPHPIDPETGRPVEGYKITRIHGGHHPHGRKMADEDWFDPKTQWIFDYLRVTRDYRNPLWSWGEQMRLKYPNYPMPGVNVEDLIRKLFPEWYGEAPEAAAPERYELPAYLREFGEFAERVKKQVAPTPTPTLPPRLQEWMRWAARLAGKRPAEEKPWRPTEVPMAEWKEPWEEREPEPRAATSWREYLRIRRREPKEAALPEVEAPPPAYPGIAPPTKAISIEELVERAKALIAPVMAAGAEVIPPEEIQAGLERGYFPLAGFEAVKASLVSAAQTFPALAPVAAKWPASPEEILSLSLLPAEWAEYALGQGMVETITRTRTGDVPEELKGDPKAEAEYDLGNLLAGLDDQRREMLTASVARIAWSPPQNQLKAANRILDPTEYEGWAHYEGDLVEIELGVPLKPGYEPVAAYDPDVITKILREEEHALTELFLRSLIDPLNLLYIPEVRAAPAAVWRRLTRAQTPLGKAERVFAEYKAAGGVVPEYAEEFLKTHRNKPGWFQRAVANIVDDWFRPLASRYEAWKARGAPAVIMALPEKGGDFTEYMRAAANAEREIRRSYALVYPRAGTSDPNFVEMMAKAISGGLNPAQIREMQVLRIEAEAYRAMGNAAGAEEKVAALEKIAQEGLPLSQRWRMLWNLFKTKAGSMELFRPVPAASREVMAENATRVLGWMFEDMKSGLDRATAALLFKKDPKQLLNQFPWLNSKAGLDAFMLLQHIRDDSLGSLAHATGVPSINTQAGWTALHEALRRVAGTYYYPAPRPDPWQRMIGAFYKIAPRTFLSTGRYPLQNIISNFENIWGRYGWVRPRTDTSSLEWVNRFMGDAGFLPPGFARSITAAGEVSTERIPTLLGRKWVYEGPRGKPREPVEVPEELKRVRVPTDWAKRLVKGAVRYFPFMEGWIDLSKWGERNASMANYMDMVENLKGAQGQPGRGFLPGVPETVEANPEMRKALEEIIGSSWNWGQIIERAAKLYGYKPTPKAAHFLSTERIRNLGAEAIDVADDLMEALSLSPSKAAFRRRYQLIRDGMDKQAREWIQAEPDFPEGVELPMAPLEGLSPEEAQRLMALTGATERNQRHIARARHLLVDLARKSGLPIEKAIEIADVAIDKAWNAYSAYGPEATKIRDYFWNVVVAEDPAKRRLWPVYEEKIRKLAVTSHENFDREIANAAMRLGGDPGTIRDELGITPWAGPPKDIAARKMRDLQDDIVNTVYEMQALELSLAPEGVETPPLDSIRAIQDWVQEKPLAANAWLEYMRDAIAKTEEVTLTPAQEIREARRESWMEGATRRIELMESKIARLQEEIATAPVEAADVEQLVVRQNELYEQQVELAALREQLKELPTHREVFRFWDFKEGRFRNIRDPSGRVAEFAQSQIVQEIAHHKWGLEQSTQGAEKYGELIRERLEVYDRINALENIIWEDPEIILPETAEGLETFIRQSEPQLEQMILYEREPYLFESALQAYEEAVDRLRKIRAGEALPESVASRIESAKAEIARIQAEQGALQAEIELRQELPLFEIPKPVSPGSLAIPEERVAEAVGAELPEVLTLEEYERSRGIEEIWNDLRRLRPDLAEIMEKQSVFYRARHDSREAYKALVEAGEIIPPAEAVGASPATERLLIALADDADFQRMMRILGLEDISVAALPEGTAAQVVRGEKRILFAGDIAERLGLSEEALRTQPGRIALFHEVGHILNEQAIVADAEGFATRWSALVREAGDELEPLIGPISELDREFTRFPDREKFARLFQRFITDPESLPATTQDFFEAELRLIAPPAEAVAPEVVRIPTMITNAQREALRELGYSDAMIGQMTPEQALGLIEGRLKDFAPPEAATGPLRDVESPVMPPSPREGAELKRDMLLQRMEEWYKDALKLFDKPLEGDPANAQNVLRWLEDELRGPWGQMKIWLDKMGEAATSWTLHDYRKMNVDTLMYRGFWWPYWQTRTGYKWLRTFMEKPALLALWARWHDTHRKINDDLPEAYRDTVHIPDWIPVVGGRYWNPYFFFDPIYAWTWSLENFIPTWRREGFGVPGFLKAMVISAPISPLVGMSEWLQPMIVEEGRRLEPITPWTRAVYERTGINIEAGVMKGLETAYSEIKPTIYAALERGGVAIGRPELAERVLGGPEVTPVITEGRYQPTYMARVLIDMWIRGEITEEEMNEAMAAREGPIWERAEDEVRAERGLTEFSSIFTGVRARHLYPSEYDIEEFRRMRDLLRTMEEGPEKRNYREQIYEKFPWARQWDVRYDSAESAKMELTINQAWQDVENEGVISEHKLAEAIRSRPGDLAHAREIQDQNHEREQQRRQFWQRQGVSFLFNPRTRTYDEVEDYVQREILSLFYDHLPQADKFRDEEGAIDWDAYNEATERFWEGLPKEIVTWGDVIQLDREASDALGLKIDVLSLAQEVATKEAYDEYRKRNDIPEEALNAVWKKYIIDPANEYYQEELKPLEYTERNMAAFFAEFSQKDADELIPYIMVEYPGRWTEEELRERLGDITMPGIWERWNQDADEKSIAINLLWSFWGGQTQLGKRRMKETINDPIYNQFFLDKENRNYERITNAELERWLGTLGIVNPWDNRDNALRILYYWSVDSTGEPILYREEEPEARGRPPGLASPPRAEPPPGTPAEPRYPPEAYGREGTPPEEAPLEPPRTVPQLAGTSESEQYVQALREMEAWVAGGKVGDWTPLMEKWFGRDTPASFFWEYYWAEIPPGRIADDVRKDPIIEMLLNKAFRTVYDVKEGVYEQALETLKTWREAHPELPGDPQEWAVVRQIVQKYWELREAGSINEAKALWMHFAPLLEKYYPSQYKPFKPSPMPARYRRGGRPEGLAAWRRWGRRRWPRIRYYPRR